MQERIALTGNEAMALAMKQINPDVVAAYPITPQTEIVQIFSDYVANGRVKTEFITVESEHSAMSATVGAASSGVRAMTATSSQGLALMWEVVYIAASNRLPIVMPVVNRALSGPINIHGDHSDTMGARDSGWIQIYSENTQEAYDNLIQAVRIAEHPDVLLPVMVMMDGFIISHAMENLFILSDQDVQKFVGEFKPHRPSLLDVDNPVTVGPLALYDYYMEFKRQQAEAMRGAKPVILEVAKEYAELTGRKYGLFDAYKLDDADLAIVVLSSTAGTARYVVDELREKGIKAGLLKLRVFRPFPYEELAQVLADRKAIAVMDRADSYSAFGGPLFTEVRSAMYDAKKRPPIVNYIYGLGGRDVNLDHIRKVYNDLVEIARTGEVTQLVNYLGVRE
ncbi:MAG: pyruvate ferredoxin oxidoreductase alpha subunit [Bacillota bacterium]|jgi:pyruvate ferredoxin oxidoreductase alpha subunit|nr:pyruvate ferredoxin oxidoreductase alpha subunit [Bacillota bacterium]MDK2881754.1 pyruvate ferredoxin oxidoreductase alpha subunit [Bacillota bacterium]MDK2960213.1 pyruvate ferredoxin oxidoreductase alpha subunit [Bacillota bacterium]